MDFELFRLKEEKSKAKRASNRNSTPDLLRDRGISFTSHNSGAHIIIKHNERVFDLWPGTGKWIERAGNYASGRGVFRLLEVL